MTVRLTPTESDTPPPQVPAPTNPSDVQVTSVAPDVSGPVTPDVATQDDPPTQEPVPDRDGTAAETRRAIREARRQRRRTAWLCAAVVAVSLALTIAVVSLARQRPVTPPASLDAPAAAVEQPATVPAATLDRTVRPPVPSVGAPASEGGNR